MQQTFDIFQQSKNYSLTNKIFEIIQNDILNGRYSEGEWLCESRLCRELGVSRTPIREAIKQLEQERLIRIIPNKGAVVLGISSQDINDIYTIRILIEGLAAKLAAEKITADEIQELEEVIALMKIYTDRSDIENLLKIDSRFHTIIYNASKNKPLVYILSTFHHYVQRARVASFKSASRAIEAFQEHKAIFEAIADRNPSLSETLSCRHVKNATVNLLTQFKE